MKALKYIYDQLFPAIFMSLILAFALSLTILWEGINTRYFEKQLLDFQVTAENVEDIAYSYVDTALLDTVITVGFWAMGGAIGLFIIWVLMNTYTSISNIFIIQNNFSNKAVGYLGKVIVDVIAKIVVTMATIIAFIVCIKTLIPYTVNHLGAHLLSNDINSNSIMMSLAWLGALTLIIQAYWLIFQYSTRFLRTSV